MDEAELISAAQAGDRAAFDELVRRTFVDTFTLARRLTGNEEDGRDVVQDAYLRAWRGIGKFRGEAAFSTWMYRITANAAATHVKRRRRQQAEPVRRRLRARRRPRRDLQPAAMAESAEALERISDALDELPPKLRSVVVLKDVYDLLARGDRRRARHHGRGGEGAAAPGPPQAARRAVRRRSRGSCGVTRSPRCCPGMVDGDVDVDPAGDARTSRRACAARPSSPGTGELLRTLALLRTRYAEPTPGLLGETLAALTDAAEEGARRTLLSGRRLAYAGAIGGTAVAAGATAALLIARSRRRSMRLAG